MECCRSSLHDGGYATPAALVVCLALSLVGIAMVVRSVAVLRLARSDLEITQVTYALAGAQLEAAAAVVRTSKRGPYHWTFTTDLGWVEAWAEPERDKLSLAAAAELGDEVLSAFGVKDPAQLRAKLKAADGGQGVTPADVSELDEAPAWRKCAPSLVSPYGEAKTPALAAYATPSTGPGPEPQSWRIGEPWRVAVTTAAGWRDDRIVRFTGDASRPAAVVARRFKRESVDGGQCESLLQSVARG